MPSFNRPFDVCRAARLERVASRCERRRTWTESGKVAPDEAGVLPIIGRSGRGVNCCAVLYQNDLRSFRATSASLCLEVIAEAVVDELQRPVDVPVPAQLVERE